jgi:hypothetical protein
MVDEHTTDENCVSNCRLSLSALVKNGDSSSESFRSNKGDLGIIFCTLLKLKYTNKCDYRKGGSFSRKSVKYDEIERVVAYRKVLMTWSRWVEEHIDPNRTTVLFMGVSPVHMQ